MMVKEELIHYVLDYRCKRCGAPFGRKEETTRDILIDLAEHMRSYHHCEDEGVGIGELIGYHEPHSHSPNTLPGFPQTAF